MPRMNVNPLFFHVILAESDPLTGDRLAWSMRNHNFDVSWVKDAAQAVVRAIERRPDLVVSNVALEDSSGWLLVAKLRHCALNARAWLYSSQPATNDRLWAEYLGVDRLLYHEQNRVELAAVLAAQTRRLRRDKVSAVAASEAPGSPTVISNPHLNSTEIERCRRHL